MVLVLPPVWSAEHLRKSELGEFTLLLSGVCIEVGMPKRSESLN